MQLLLRFATPAWLEMSLRKTQSCMAQSYSVWP